jgi:hypothetical protein
MTVNYKITEIFYNYSGIYIDLAPTPLYPYPAVMFPCEAQTADLEITVFGSFWLLQLHRALKCDEGWALVGRALRGREGGGVACCWVYLPARNTHCL